ncbi:MAG: DUF4136 domain-containing protein [Chitinophagales bacterium]
MKSSIKFITLIFFSAIFLLEFTSCQETMHVESKKYGSAKLKDYKTYAWLVPTDTLKTNKANNAQLAKLIKDASDAELQKKGLVIDSIHPDALFMWDTHLQKKVQYVQTSPQVSVGVGIGGPGYYVGGSAPVAGGKVQAVPYTEGTLVIAMFDAKSGSVIWKGWATKQLGMQNDVQSDIKTATKNIFARLYVKHKQ